MRIRMFAVPLCVLLLAACCIAFNFLSSTSATTENVASRISEAEIQNEPANNATNPDDIPDRLAYLTDEADIVVLMSAATEFQARVSALDTQAVQLKHQNRINPNLAVTMQLARLQQDKEDITDNIVASLSARLSNHAKHELRRFMREHVKRNIRLN